MKESVGRKLVWFGLDCDAENYYAIFDNGAIYSLGGEKPVAVQASAKPDVIKAIVGDVEALKSRLALAELMEDDAPVSESGVASG